MAKPTLAEPFQKLEKEVIDVLLRGHKKWRPDLPYPESHSDMQAAVRELLENYDLVPIWPRVLPTEEGDAHIYSSCGGREQ